MSSSEILQQWPDVYSAFKNSFDTPQMKRLVKNECSENARKRLDEFNELLLTIDKDEKRVSEKLGQAIADAAMKAGIYNGEVLLTGLHLTVLADNLAQTIVDLTKGWIPITERLPKPYSNVAIGEPGLIKGIAWYRDINENTWETDQGHCDIEFTHWYEIKKES